MFPFRLYAATGDAVAQLDSLTEETVDVSLNLEGRGVMCVSPHPRTRLDPSSSQNSLVRSR
jgi:hypothetical protein